MKDKLAPITSNQKAHRQLVKRHRYFCITACSFGTQDNLAVASIAFFI
jgi:hypothetical protein